MLTNCCPIGAISLCACLPDTRDMYALSKQLETNHRGAFEIDLFTTNQCIVGSSVR